jgi:hypothetical protein
MDQHGSEVGRLAALSSNTQIRKFLTRIDEKVGQLKTNGMTRSDRELLKSHRLNFTWGEITEESDNQNATTWRKGRARRTYAEIQDANDDLFLAVLLAIPPTECAKTSFDKVLEYLVRLENYGPYRLSLSSTTKNFFESMAAEQGFASSHRYLTFMQAMFPQGMTSISVLRIVKAKEVLKSKSLLTSIPP